MVSEREASEPVPNTRLEILYEGHELVAIQKPSGLAVHRGWAPEKDVAMRRLRNQLRKWVWPVHRLDRGTSGVLLFALNKERAGEIGRLFQEGLIKKNYLALVRGVPAPEGEIDYAIPRSEGGERIQAFTRYRVLESLEGYSLVQAQTAQGRFHQIRRHFKHLRNPLIGDTNYGDGKRNRFWREHYQLHRLGLHAWTLSFEDPASGELIRIVAPLPDDLANPLAQIGMNLEQLNAELYGDPWAKREMPRPENSEATA